jgi:hypothetical protein
MGEYIQTDRKGREIWIVVTAEHPRVTVATRSGRLGAKRCVEKNGLTYKAAWPMLKYRED